MKWEWKNGARIIRFLQATPDRVFSTAEIYHQFPGASDTHKTLLGLLAAGYLTRPKRGHYKLSKLGAATPAEFVIRKSTVQTHINDQSPGYRTIFWRLLRIRPRSIHAAMELMDVKNHEPVCAKLREFVRALEKSGYVRSPDAGLPYTQKTFYLVKNTGPAAPLIVAECVLLDMNNRAAFSTETGQQLVLT